MFGLSNSSNVTSTIIDESIFVVWNSSTSKDSSSSLHTEENFPLYLRITVTFLCTVVLSVGSFGNILVPIVVCSNMNMRTSTNFFLVNLSVADLLILFICVPTILVEVNAKPETWALGETMCKIVPFFESTACYGSVLTILAISFERYYAICHPLKAAYICTKARAIYVIVLVWIWAILITSPVLSFTSYRFENYIDNTTVPVCLTEVHTTARVSYFIVTTVILFLLPFPVLVVIYSRITKKLMSKGPMARNCRSESCRTASKTTDICMTARKQVIAMLIAVIVCFFICLFPIRIFYLWYIAASMKHIQNLGPSIYFNILYSCRILLYFNSTINPILYNAISSKFRKGFKRQLHCELFMSDAANENRRLTTRKSNMSMGTLSTTRSGCK